MYCNTQASELLLLYPHRKILNRFWKVFFLLVWRETTVSTSVYTSLQRRKNETHIVGVASGLGISQGSESILEEKPWVWTCLIDTAQRGPPLAFRLFTVHTPRTKPITFHHAASTPTHLMPEEMHLATSKRERGERIHEITEKLKKEQQQMWSFIHCKNHFLNLYFCLMFKK